VKVVGYLLILLYRLIGPTAVILWDTAFQVSGSPFRRAVEKGKEGAGRIRNQMEARAAYAGNGHREGEPDNVEVLADWAASWRRRVYGVCRERP
jgi:hypothetical protein